ncbi:MAG TPA: MlaD family protein [Thermoleophilaceae bacterium]|nr:MlaD family protein [Thermoleophilaceae bacterium]
MTPYKAGLIAIVLVVIGSYFAYTRSNPFAEKYEFQAAFHTSNNLAPDAPVRIAGVDVGTVAKVEPLEPGADAAMVTMEMSDEGLPIHEDAELQIRPRIFLEGNEFVDLEPGSPSAPVLEEGDTIPINQTATPVQLGQVITVLDKDSREDLRTIFEEYAFRGLNGSARAFNRSIRFWEPAYRNSALANQALLGTEAGDLSRLIEGQQKTLAALAEQPEVLQDFVTNFNVTAAAFAREDDALQAAIPALRDVLTVGEPALASLNSSFPGIQRFAVDALPGVRSSQVTIPETFPFIRQARLLFQPSELRGLAADLRRGIPPLARLNRRAIPFLNQARQLSACTNEVLLPFSQTPVPNGQPGNRPVDDPSDDPNLDKKDFEFAPEGEPFFKQGPRSFVGLSGESRTFDANGEFFRVNFRLDNAATVVQTPASQAIADLGPVLSLSGTAEQSRPAPPTQVEEQTYQQPHFRPDFPCELSKSPDLRAPQVGTDNAADGGGGGGGTGPLPPLPLGAQSQEQGGQDSPDGEAGALGGGLEENLEELGPGGSESGSEAGGESGGQAQEGGEQP